MAMVTLGSRALGVNVKNAISADDLRSLKNRKVRDLFREYTVNHARALEVLAWLKERQNGRERDKGNACPGIA